MIWPDHIDHHNISAYCPCVLRTTLPHDYEREEPQPNSASSSPLPRLDVDLFTQVPLHLVDASQTHDEFPILANSKFGAGVPISNHFPHRLVFLSQTTWWICGIDVNGRFVRKERGVDCFTHTCDCLVVFGAVQIELTSGRRSQPPMIPARKGARLAVTLTALYPLCRSIRPATVYPMAIGKRVSSFDTLVYVSTTFPYHTSRSSSNNEANRGRL